MFGTVESLEIHILLKIKLELIDYILIDYKVISPNFAYNSARKQNEAVQWFVKHLFVISFLGRFQIRNHY